MKKYRVIRDIGILEAPWLPFPIKKGDLMYEYLGFTYACISPKGIAVTKAPFSPPFLELPKDSLEEIKE